MPFKNDEQYCRTPAARKILHWLSDPSMPKRHSTIAQALGLTTTTVNSLISRLARHGYLRKEITVTDAGRALLKG